MNRKLIGIMGVLGVFSVFGVSKLIQRNKVKQESLKWQGMEEMGNNQAFKNPLFQEKMKEAGFKKGMEWCMLFAKMIWLQVYKHEKELIQKLITPSTQQTWRNFLRSPEIAGKFKVITDLHKPKVGDIAIWQRLSNPDAGHAGVITKITSRGFNTVEGNTNEDGSANGYGVFVKTNTPISRRTMKLLGFLRKI